MDEADFLIFSVSKCITHKKTQATLKKNKDHCNSKQKLAAR